MDHVILRWLMAGSDPLVTNLAGQTALQIAHDREQSSSGAFLFGAIRRMLEIGIETRLACHRIADASNLL